MQHVLKRTCLFQQRNTSLAILYSHKLPGGFHSRTSLLVSSFKGETENGMSSKEQFSGYSFGPWPISPTEVFATSPLCFAFVNLKPIVPGHVLVSTKRIVPRFTDLTPEETQDLWALAQRVGAAMERHHNASSLTLTIQDGPDAGQTVPHVHVHVLPRKANDFVPNDKVYDAIDTSSQEFVATSTKKDLDEDRPERTAEEMAEEAIAYRTYFTD